ncbi:MAG: T9SS type A sorting domain-containing protein [Bacteroidetes bacterium]|nr:T9SS type A sorting domain-containing protein [Bacteroidota bacterium]
MKKLLLISSIVLLSLSLPAQGPVIWNSSGHIVSQSGTYWVVDNGNFTLKSESADNPAQMANLNIAADASLTIEPLNYLTVSGTLANSGTLTLSSTSSGTGSLIVTGSSTGNITTQRYFPGSLQSWHMVSTPVSGMDISTSNFVVTPAENYDFYAWNEPSPGTWVNYKTDDPEQDPTFLAINGNDNFLPGKGYLVAYNAADPTKTFTGTLNTGNQTYSLKNSPAKDWDYNAGWNLLGNPYSSAIDWNEADRSLFWGDFAYAYNPQAHEGTGDFEEIDGSNENAYIAANQGFFVIVDPTTANNSVFTFTNAMQNHGGTYYKNMDEDEKLVIRLTGELYYDETTVRQRDESTFNKDRVDAFQMNSYNVNAPNVYSISEDNIHLAINSIPEIGAEHSIRMGMVAPKSGLYKLQVVEANNYMMDNKIYLEDLLLNNWHKISESEYSFTTEEGDINDRFVIHFGVVGVEETSPLEEILQLWTNNSTINLRNPENIAGELRVYNMIGQIVERTSLNRNTSQQINLLVPDGFYVVNILTKSQMINKKVYLR